MPAKTPEQTRAYDAARCRFKRVKIRLAEDEAQRLRNAAAGGKLNIRVTSRHLDGGARPYRDSLGHYSAKRGCFPASRRAQIARRPPPELPKTVFLSNFCA
jgi:hypothetical protein